MFSKELSAALLRILGLRDLHYETASELCGMSAKHFGNIVRGSASPTLGFFEKLCVGLGVTPNELLGYPSDEELSFRHAEPIRAAYSFRFPDRREIYAACPRCGHLILREADNYCCNCGQALSWSDFDLDKIQITELL